MKQFDIIKHVGGIEHFSREDDNAEIESREVCCDVCHKWVPDFRAIMEDGQVICGDCQSK
jgi:formylmethanofuran dehydrogenase subunit E